MRQRSAFLFTPPHNSWLYFVENLFSEVTRTMLRKIRVAAKEEPIDRIHRYFEAINPAPPIYKMVENFIA